MTCKCAICGYERGITEVFNKWPDIPGLQTVFYPVTKFGKPDSEVLKALGGSNTQESVNAIPLN